MQRGEQLLGEEKRRIYLDSASRRKVARERANKIAEVDTDLRFFGQEREREKVINNLQLIR